MYKRQGSTAPKTYPAHVSVDNCYALNAGLTAWAYERTRGLKLPDNAAMEEVRARWKGHPLASAPPTVIVGDSYSGDAYWHGEVMTQAANDWVTLWTKGKGNFVMTNMEDSGVAEALRRLDALHKADSNRLMVLRVGSNFSQQAPGRTALESVTTPYIRSTAFDIAWMVGHAVVHELETNWAKYQDHTPGVR